MRFYLSTFLLSSLAIILNVNALQYLDYDNDFLDPAFVLSKNFSSSTAAAQQNIVGWADYLAEQGPWSPLNKTVNPPTGNKQDYLSWAPYYWPDCSKVGNTTALTPEQIWTTCPYQYRDGQFNPDRLLVNDTGHFQAMSDAVFYNALAWVITGSSKYSQNAANFLDTWFVNPATAQTPNLQYSQIQRGPGANVGSHTGLLDLRQFPKLTTAILVLREGKSAEWTTQLDAGMTNWTTNYLKWVTTSPIAYQEWIYPNNHGTFFYNQLIALQILVGDKTAAINSTQTYFANQFMSQIAAGGEQPEEATRTHPYHYRCYNLAAMVTNAKLGKYLGLDMWSKKSTAGTTIQDAADFTMTQHIATPSDGDGPIWELYPPVAAVAAAYGDPQGKYAAFLAAADNEYPAEPYFLFNQPLSDSGLAAATPTADASTPASTGMTTGHSNGAIGMAARMGVVVGVVSLFVLL